MFFPLPRAGGKELLALARMSLVLMKGLFLWSPSKMCVGASVTGVHSPNRDLCCPGPPGSEHPGIFEHSLAWMS